MIFGVVADACTSMCFQAKLSCSGEAIKLVTFPPCAFIHASVDLAMVPAAQPTVNSSLTLRPRARGWAKRR